MMQEPEYTIGPRILSNGVNLDAGIRASIPVIQKRQIDDPVSDGSLGEPGYEPGQKNFDGTLI